MLRWFLGAILMCSPMMTQADPVASVRYYTDGAQSKVILRGGATLDTPFTLASIGKLMTSVVILQLIEGGELNLAAAVAPMVDADVTDGLGGLKGVTLRHLLTMRSGLPDYLDDAFIEDALDGVAGTDTAGGALRYAFGAERVFAPGGGFDYSNTNYVLLGHIIERTTGQSYAAALQDMIFDPLKMRDSFVFDGRALPQAFPFGHEDGEHIRAYYTGHGFGDGGVISTAPDLARFYQAVFGARSVVSPASYAELIRDDAGQQYGMGVEIEGVIYGHSGGDLGFATDVRMNVETGEIAIILVADAEADTDWTFERLRAN